MVGYVRRNHMTPLPVAASYDARNAGFLDACTKRGRAILRGQTATATFGCNGRLDGGAIARFSLRRPSRERHHIPVVEDAV